MADRDRRTLLGRLLAGETDHLKLVHQEDRQRVWRLVLDPLELRGRINHSITATAILDRRDKFIVRGTLDNGWMDHATVDAAEEEGSHTLQAKLEFAAPDKDYCAPVPFCAERKEKGK
ncbi:hypothetical protein TW95_gp0614 [Pandoravirus inopinatum]|uniref:Uncharacterized protein n=1 Tax=Pandoravirus inopinatum TaxID=1605721 RepID=A0A0B5IX83_9VIRU|nr:hypothetical protein TW95_gp0614 [Pandoravirus inopinatum]AJF97348.1 hypothetical protein [Pandoravirus inopinatum]